MTATSSQPLQRVKNEHIEPSVYKREKSSRYSTRGSTRAGGNRSSHDNMSKYMSNADQPPQAMLHNAKERTIIDEAK